MSRHPKAPPRFIPTLTEVVPLPPPDASPPSAATPPPAPASPPPWMLDIPTLADSIDAALGSNAPARSAIAASAPTSPALPGTLSAEQEARLVERLLQRLEHTLEQRLQQAIDHIVQEQTALALPRLRNEVRSLVQQTVGEAVAQEWINARTPGRQDLPPPNGAFAKPRD